MKVTLQAKSSSGGSYPVEFSDESDALRVFCHCPAGSLQQMCRHKIGLLKGDYKMLFNPTEQHLMDQLLASTAYAALKPKLDSYEAALASNDREIAKLKAKEKALKSDFAHELTFGRRSHLT